MSYAKLEDQFGRLNLQASDADLARRIQEEELQRFAEVANPNLSQIAADEAFARTLAQQEYLNPNAIRPVNHAIVPGAVRAVHSHMKWQFLDGNWQDYPVDASKALERIYLQYLCKSFLLNTLLGVHVRANGRLYYVDFRSLQQTNITQGKPSAAGPKQLRRVAVCTSPNPSPHIPDLNQLSRRWEYYDNYWRPYSVDASKTLEIVFNARDRCLAPIESIVVQVAAGQTYSVVFSKNQQVSLRTNTTRNIRRVPR